MAKTCLIEKQKLTPKFKVRKFGICRICFREMAHSGLIPGVTKSSW